MQTKLKLTLGQSIKLSSTVKKLKGSVKFPDDFDYKKELKEAISQKYKIPVLSPETTIKLIMSNDTGQTDIT